MILNMLSVQQDIDRLVNRNRVFFKHRKSFHDAMQNDITKLGSQYGFRSVKEYRVIMSNGSNGFIDVVWLNQGNLVLAIRNR